MKRILGLDLGVTSIGWAVVSEDNGENEILGMGSRIIPLSSDDKDEFSSGNKISKNQKRTIKRTQRKGYDRYQLRRKNLVDELMKFNMYDPALFRMNILELWGTRAKAVNENISLPELGRVLYHLNQKRGYKSSRCDANLDKKDTEYVFEIKSRHQQLKDQGMTIGQKFFDELQKNQNYRVKQQVFPREAYVDEFNLICKQQQKHYPDVVTDNFINKIRDEIIYYQRKLKSQKGLVSVCEFEGFWTKNMNGKDVFAGPKVAPRSSPLFQVCKIWETINNINLKNKRCESYIIPVEKKKEIFDFLDNNERLSQSELFKLVGINKNDGWYGNKHISKGLQGNLTKSELLKLIDPDSNLLTFDLEIDEKPEETFLLDRKTGEILGSNYKKCVLPHIENQTLYQLWHTIYSISDMEECKIALIKKFRIEEVTAEKLANIDFTRAAFGNKSVKAMRKILPYLMEGFQYSDACSYAGYNHSLTSDGNVNRKLLDIIPNLPKNSLRQPVVEKIINQLINVVNTINKKYGKVDEIRIELARELKQSRAERNETFVSLQKIDRENEIIRQRIQKEYGLRATRNNVIKWRLFHEINGDESKINALCIYCGQSFGISEALRGGSVDVEHIIPKSLLFDDSQSNKTLSHRSCNEDKGNRTAYDYMSGKGEFHLNNYAERIDNLYMNKIIGKTKRDKLLMTENKIPKDFIERQLRETQYIARKAKEILEQVCHNVWSTSGKVTDHLRKLWGWNDVLMNLQVPKFRESGLTEWIEIENFNGQKQKKEVINGWTKRDDHRHHAIDALTIACTRQGFIQRINTLCSRHTRDELFAEVEKQSVVFREKLGLLDKYLILQRPFSTKQVESKTEEILISFKAGKKICTKGRRTIKKDGRKIILQKGIIVPRGPLSEESVYGKIQAIEKRKPMKYLFENPHLILKPKIKELIVQRLSENGNDAKKALTSLKKEPLYLNQEKTIVLEFGTCYKVKYVLKYPLNSIKAKDLEDIVDGKIKKIIDNRLSEFIFKEKEAFKDPLYFNEENGIVIKSVRMFTGLDKVEPVKKDSNGRSIGFVKSGNNHHIAFYIDEKGRKQEHVCSFWHAVERVKYGISAVIKDPQNVWDKVIAGKDQYQEAFLKKLPKDNWKFELSLQQNEMFVLGLDPNKLDDADEICRKKLIGSHLYRVQKIGSGDYWFRLHTETQIIDSDVTNKTNRYYRVRSVGAFEKLYPKKMQIDVLGEIVSAL